MRCHYMDQSASLIQRRHSTATALEEHYGLSGSALFALACDLKKPQFWTPQARPQSPPFYPSAVALYLRHFWQHDTDPGFTPWPYGFEQEMQCNANVLWHLSQCEREQNHAQNTEDHLIALMQRQASRLLVIWTLHTAFEPMMPVSRELVREVSGRELLKARTTRRSVLSCLTDDFENWALYRWLPLHLHYGFQQHNKAIPQSC